MVWRPPRHTQPPEGGRGDTALLPCCSLLVLACLTPHAPEPSPALCALQTTAPREPSIDRSEDTVYPLWSSRGELHRPSSDTPAGVHSHTLERVLRPRGCCPSVMFRPRGFSPPRRLAPLAGSGFVAPRFRKGFAGFRPRMRSGMPRHLATALLTSGPHPWLPTDASTPRRPLPNHSLDHVSMTVFPPAVFTPCSACASRVRLHTCSADSAPLQGLAP